MDSCGVLDASSYCPALLGNSTDFLIKEETCAFWQSEYIYAQQPRETRIWNKAKDLLYGYAVIWIIMCLPKLYSHLHNMPFKRFLFNLTEWKRNWRKSSIVLGETGQIPKQYLDSGCPVCLASPEEMSALMPVHGDCGHALCADCFVGMWSHGKTMLYPLSCPLCTATFHKISPVSSCATDRIIDEKMEQLDRTVRRYNLVFNGGCIGILPTSGKTVYRTVMDIVSRTLRLGYFFVLFDRKMMNTISFFLMHFVIAIVVEYFENAYLQSLLEHL